METCHTSKLCTPLTCRNIEVLREAGLLRAQSLRLAVPGQEVACSLLYNTLRIHYGPNLNHKRDRPAVVVMAGTSDVQSMIALGAVQATCLHPPCM
jgi:predicted transcriptional regulator